MPDAIPRLRAFAISLTGNITYADDLVQAAPSRGGHESHRWYCSSETCSIQSTGEPLSFSWMAIWLMAVVGDAPCQCFSPGSNQTTSPGRSASIGPPSRWARPKPAVTMSAWPRGCVCHAVRAPGSKVTALPAARAGAAAPNRGSIRTVPVNHSAGPLPEGCEPLRLMSIAFLLRLPRHQTALGTRGTG